MTERTTKIFNRLGGDEMAILPGGLIEFLHDAGDEAKLTAAILIGIGAAGHPATTAEAGKNFAGAWTESTDATGADSRGLYWRHYLSGAGASGEAVRAYTTITAAGAVGAHGFHASLSVSGSGTITGEGAAARHTLSVPNSTLGGTVGATYSELYAEGTSSNASNVQFQRYVFGGNATGIASLEDVASLFSIEGATIASGNVVQAKSSAAVTHVVRIKIGGTPYYLMVSDAV